MSGTSRPSWCPFDGQPCGFPDCTYDVDECAVLDQHHGNLPATHPGAAPEAVTPAEPKPEPAGSSPLFNGLEKEIRWG